MGALRRVDDGRVDGEALALPALARLDGLVDAFLLVLDAAAAGGTSFVAFLLLLIGVRKGTYIL